MKIKIRKIDFVIYALFLALFKIYVIPQFTQQLLKVILLIGVMFFIVTHANRKKILNVIVPLGTIIVLSGILSYEAGFVGPQSIYNGLLHAICLYAIYMISNYCAEHDYLDGMVTCLFSITSIYCLLSLGSMVLLGHSDKGTEITYFFGYKFMTSYYFILWIALFRVKYQKEIDTFKRYELLYFFLSVIVLLVCRWLYCSTAIIASFLLIIIPFMPQRVKQMAMNPITVIIAIIAAGIVPFAIDGILKVEFVQHIITDVLNKNLSLTGRLKIYAFLGQVISHRKWMGYGYGNIAVESVVGYGNAQNGLMQLLVDYGLVGTIMFFAIIFQCLKKRQLSDRLEGIFIVLNAMIICSIVEISYNYIFYLVLFMIGSFSKKQQVANKDVEKMVLYHKIRSARL